MRQPFSVYTGVQLAYLRSKRAFRLESFYPSAFIFEEQRNDSMPGDGTSFIAGSYLSGFYGPDSSFFAVLSTAFNNSVF